MELVQKHNVKDYLPPQNGWYDTNEGNIYFFVKEQTWSCRDDRISEKYPVWWLNPIPTSENSLHKHGVSGSLPDEKPLGSCMKDGCLKPMRNCGLCEEHYAELSGDLKPKGNGR